MLLTKPLRTPGTQDAEEAEVVVRMHVAAAENEDTYIAV
jgi:hypothetical protein